VADHNDPNAVNSIFSDIDVSAADLYDIFGFPSDDTSSGEKIVIALTFAAVPHTGVLDPDMLYRILIAPDRRFVRSAAQDTSLEGFLAYLEAVKDKYLSVLQPAEVRVTVDDDKQARIRFLNFAGGSFSAVVATTQINILQSPNHQSIKVFIGGRDDAFLIFPVSSGRSIMRRNFTTYPIRWRICGSSKSQRHFSSSRATTYSTMTRASRNGAMGRNESCRRGR
jgi:hypothetical protein